MEKIKVAQIGVGHDHALVVMESVLRQKDIFDFSGYAAGPSEQEFLPAVIAHFPQAKQREIDDILNDSSLDAIFIETKEQNLVQYALAAIEKGLCVHMDKPGSQSCEEFARLTHLAKQKNKVLHLGYMYRYNPLIQDAIAAVKNGKLGEIYSVEAQMSCEHSFAKRNWLGQFHGGMMFFLGCHLIDLLLQLQGLPDQIFPFNTNTQPEILQAKDLGFAVFQYKNGISFVKTCAAEPGGFIRRQLVICGSKGTIEIKPLEEYSSSSSSQIITRASEVYVHDTAENPWIRCGKENISAPFGRYDSMLAHFARYVQGKKKNPYSYEYEETLHRVLLATCGFSIDYKKESPTE